LLPRKVLSPTPAPSPARLLFSVGKAAVKFKGPKRRAAFPVTAGRREEEAPQEQPREGEEEKAREKANEEEKGKQEKEEAVKEAKVKEEEKTSEVAGGCGEEEEWGRWRREPIDLDRRLAAGCLVRGWYRLTGGRPRLRVLVPAPRLRADIQWLLQQGHQVVAVHENIPSVSSLFVSLGLQHSVVRLPKERGGWTYTSSDGGLTVHTSPLLLLPPSTLGPCDAVFDSEGLSLLHPRRRREVLEVVVRSVRPGGCGLVAGAVQERWDPLAKGEGDPGHLVDLIPGVEVVSQERGPHVVLALAFH